MSSDNSKQFGSGNLDSEGTTFLLITRAVNFVKGISGANPCSLLRPVPFRTRPAFIQSYAWYSQVRGGTPASSGTSAPASRHDTILLPTRQNYYVRIVGHSSRMGLVSLPCTIHVRWLLTYQQVKFVDHIDNLL